MTLTHEKSSSPKKQREISVIKNIQSFINLQTQTPLRRHKRCKNFSIQTLRINKNLTSYLASFPAAVWHIPHILPKKKKKITKFHSKNLTPSAKIPPHKGHPAARTKDSAPLARACGISSSFPQGCRVRYIDEPPHSAGYYSWRCGGSGFISLVDAESPPWLVCLCARVYIPIPVRRFVIRGREDAPVCECARGGCLPGGCCFGYGPEMCGTSVGIQKWEENARYRLQWKNMYFAVVQAEYAFSLCVY